MGIPFRLLNLCVLAWFSVTFCSEISETEIPDEDNSICPSFYSLPAEIFMHHLFPFLGHADILRLGMTEHFVNEASGLWRGDIYRTTEDFLDSITEYRQSYERNFAKPNEYDRSNAVALYETLQKCWPKPSKMDPYEHGVFATAFKAFTKDCLALGGLCLSNKNLLINKLLLTSGATWTNRTLADAELAVINPECLTSLRMVKKLKFDPIYLVKTEHEEMIKLISKDCRSEEINKVVETGDIRHFQTWSQINQLHDMEALIILRYANHDTMYHLERLLQVFPSPAALINQFGSVLFEKGLSVNTIRELIRRCTVTRTVPITLLFMLAAKNVDSEEDRRLIGAEMVQASLIEQVKDWLEEDSDAIPAGCTQAHANLVLLVAALFRIDLGRTQKFLPFIKLDARSVVICLACGRDDLVSMLRTSADKLSVQQFALVHKHIKFSASIETFAYLMKHVDKPIELIQWIATHMAQLDSQLFFSEVILKGYLMTVEQKRNNYAGLKDLLCPKVLRLPYLPKCFGTLLMDSFGIFLELDAKKSLLSAAATFEIMRAAFRMFPLEDRMKKLVQLKSRPESFNGRRSLAVCLLSSIVDDGAYARRRAKEELCEDFLYLFILNFCPEHFYWSELVQDNFAGRSSRVWLHWIGSVKPQGIWHKDLLRRLLSKLRRNVDDSQRSIS